jgi:hypothetical protein
LAFGVGGKGTGFRGYYLVIDDPINARKQHSEPALREVTFWFDQSLHGRGHRVRFVANPVFESQVCRSRLPFVPTGAFRDITAALEANPKHPYSFSGGRALWNDFVAPNILATYAAVREAIPSLRPDAVLCDNVSFGGVWAAAERRVAMH